MKEGPTGIELTNKSSGKIGLLDAKFNHPISSAVNCKLGVGTDLLAASCAAILFCFGCTMFLMKMRIPGNLIQQIP
jgi:isocitrate dehydrogenase kinase/phosphatase